MKTLLMLLILASFQVAAHAAERATTNTPIVGVTQVGYLACENIADLRAINDTLLSGDFLEADKMMVRFERVHTCVRLESGLPATIVMHEGRTPHHYALVHVEIPGGEVFRVYTKFDAVRKD